MSQNNSISDPLFGLKKRMKNLDWGKKSSPTLNNDKQLCKKKTNCFSGMNSNLSDEADGDFNDNLEADSNIDEYDTGSDEDGDDEEKNEKKLVACDCSECVNKSQATKTKSKGSIEDEGSIQVSAVWKKTYCQLMSTIFRWRRTNRNLIHSILTCKVDFQNVDIYEWFKLLKLSYVKWMRYFKYAQHLPKNLDTFNNMKKSIKFLNNIYEAIWIFRTLNKTLEGLAQCDIVIKNVLYENYQKWVQSLKEWYPLLLQLRESN